MVFLNLPLQLSDPLVEGMGSGRGGLLAALVELVERLLPEFLVVLPEERGAQQSQRLHLAVVQQG
jgi:hypothetical protein